MAKQVVRKEDDYLPELIFGLVSRMGTDTKSIVTSLQAEANKYRYYTVHLKVTDIVKKLPSVNVKEGLHVEERYSKLIDACNKIRKSTKDNSILALLVAAVIRKMRSSVQKRILNSKDNNLNYRGVIYIIDQLKRPEEILALRAAYSDAFIAISCHSPFDIRKYNLANSIIADHGASENDDDWQESAESLIELDEAESNKFGQNVRSAFPKADFILDAKDSDSISSNLTRLFKLLFSNPSVSPTFEEYGNNLAAQAAYRSIDLSRQIGAAIFDSQRKVISIGCNEVPKSGGGTYWEDSIPDARDQNLGYDENHLRKQAMLLDVMMKLKSDGLLSSKLSKKSYEQIKQEVFDKETNDFSVKKSQVLDITEFGRALHAEMNAITDAARSNESTQNSSLFVTTFPCHNCAKHIVGSGIAEVFFLEPYPKSQASALYPDSIKVDPSEKRDGVVQFKQFCGVTKLRYRYFSKDRLKDASGKVHSWSEAKAECQVKLHPTEFLRSETEVVSRITSVKRKKSTLGPDFG